MTNRTAFTGATVEGYEADFEKSLVARLESGRDECLTPSVTVIVTKE
jgi:hypothetical protein